MMVFIWYTVSGLRGIEKEKLLEHLLKGYVLTLICSWQLKKVKNIDE